MKSIKGALGGLLTVAAVLLLLPALGQAQIKVHCTGTKGGPALASKLNSAAGAKDRTLFVSGTCIENVTVRNLRVVIDGSLGGTLAPLVASTPAITFTGGTTDATLQNMNIDGTGNTTDIVAVTNNAAVVIRTNTITNGSKNGINVFRGSLVTLGTNTVLGGAVGLNITSQALVTLSNGNTSSSTTGIKCRAGSVVTFGTSSARVTSWGVNDGVPLFGNVTMTSGGNTSCFNDQ